MFYKNKNKSPKPPRHSVLPPRDGFLIVVPYIFTLGMLGLAILDEGQRPAFAELAKIVISGFIGWMMPRL